MDGYIVRAGEGVDGDPELKASASSTGGALTLFESTAQGGAPRHVHEREDECFYVLDGTISISCGREEWQASAGSFVFLPRRVPHAWDVIGDSATVLILTVPGGFEAFMREFHDATDDQRADVGRRHGIEFLSG